ncbi:MAG: hypothetical protein WBQ60_03450 [Asticcacaulis sp.]
MALPDPLIHDHLHDHSPNVESSVSGIHWASILGGATVATAVSLILLPLGSALGFSTISIFAPSANETLTFGLGWAIWLVVMQWISSGFGGYIAGRLRVKWADTHSDEVFFRDTAHGFIAWSVATVFTLGFVALFSAVSAPHIEQTDVMQTAQETQKTMAGLSLAMFVSLLTGAFIASVSAAIGGRLRDKP